MEDALEEFNCELLGDPASSEVQRPSTEPEQHQQHQQEQQVSESTTTTATGEISTDDLMRAASDLLAEQQAVLAPDLEDSGDGLGDGLPLGLDELNSTPYRARCNTWPRLQNFGSFNPADFGGSDGNSNSNPATSSEATNSTAGSSGEVVHPVDALEPYAQSSLALTSNLPLVDEEPPVVTGEPEPQQINFNFEPSVFSQQATASPPHPQQQQQQQQQQIQQQQQQVRPKSSSRRNPWGNLSYADLITQAISSAPEQRLTLAQIYDWLVKNVPYFSSKGDSVSSLGWKVIFAEINSSWCDPVFFRACFFYYYAVDDGGNFC